MLTKHYESVVIINAALDDEQIDSIVKTISNLITDNGGLIEDLELWGRKRLAYPIEKAKSGYYAIYRFASNPEFISKLERMYRLDENVIRYLTILLDKHAIAYYEKLKEQNANSTNDETESVENKTSELAKENNIES